MKRLIITNGDAAVHRMRQARIAGKILPWRDILHEGPVPQTSSLEDLSAIRAQFLAQRGWLDQDELRKAFDMRDQLLRQHRNFDEVLIWFEHDLYDQLQLIQILDFFAHEEPRDGLFLIQAGRYLGLESPRALKAHLHLMEPVRDDHLALAKQAWAAFRSPSPVDWASLLGARTYHLPFLKLGMLRVLEELPHYSSGLSRTENTILKLIELGIRTPRELYMAFSELEEVFFMGDWSFFHGLDHMGEGASPLIAGFKGLRFSPGLSEDAHDDYLDVQLSMTHLGISAQCGRADTLRYRKYNRAIGGFHFQPDAPWRWNNTKRCLQPPHVRNHQI